MREAVTVAPCKVALSEGFEVHLVEIDGTHRKWTKHYPSETSAGNDLHKMGLIRYRVSEGDGRTLRLEIHQVEQASMDIQLIEEFGFKMK